MNLAKRNHYNPCFWTALWSPKYHEAFIAGESLPGEARSQLVHALSVKSGRLRTSSVEKVHYDKGLAVAEITREAADDFAKRYHPDKYEEFVKENAQAEYPLLLDFESFLAGIERLRPYQIMMDVARGSSVDSVLDKTELATFVVLQQLRSHSVLNSMIEWEKELQRYKFETLVTLRWSLEDPVALYRMVLPLVQGRWTIFRTDADTFPLCDSPVLVQRHSIMVALSPRVLLEIQLPIHDPVEKMPHIRRGVKPSKVEEFRRRTIGNTFREIIFGDRSVLESWQQSSEFRNRFGLVKDLKKYNQLVIEEGDRELWHINAFGNFK